MIEEGKIGDPRTCLKEQAFNADIERLAMDSAAHVTMLKTGRGKSEPKEDILEYWNRFSYGA